MSEETKIDKRDNSYSVPEGYVLIPQAVYEMLLKSNDKESKDLKEPQSSKMGSVGANPKKIAVHLEVLRQAHLGDIRTQINPGEVIVWVPYHSISIRGKVETTMGSFLTLYGVQDEKGKNYSPKAPPFFKVLNPEDLEEATQGVVGVIRRPKSKSSEDQLASNARVEGVVFGDSHEGNLPPRGSQERKNLIASRSIESLNSGNTGVDKNSMTVQDFSNTTKKQGQHNVVGKIDGKHSAEARE